MRISMRRDVVSVAALVIAMLVWRPGDSQAADFHSGEITVTTPWARATPGPLTVGVTYLSLTNRGATADRLIGVKTVAAERVELHSTASEDGVMRMRPLESVALQPGQTLRFDPTSGLHLMLVNLSAPLKEGSEFTMQLTFERAGMIEVPVAVGAVGASDAPADPHAGHH